jgi:NAD(P)-dependent dehydrogenase (short-subunit alcohol dehydrogenase family)
MDPADIPAKRTVLVTGATDGIGRETALALAGSGMRVLVHGRDRRRTESTCDELRARVPGTQAEPLVADLSSLAAVRSLAAEVRSRTGRLDVLIHNAGVFMKRRQLSGDGYEMTFAVNHLAPFLLTALVGDLLAASAPARVVTVSSVAHQRGKLDFDNLQSERSFDGYGAYSTSKLANVLFAFELAARRCLDGITSNALHPGVVTTKLLHEGFGSTGISPADGARNSVYLATSPEVEGISGMYFDNFRPGRVAPAAEQADLRDRLWIVSERLTGLS